MTWEFKFVGNYAGIDQALATIGKRFDRDTNRQQEPDSFIVARDIICSHLIRQTQAPEIGWTVEARGGDAELLIHIQPCNLRVL